MNIFNATLEIIGVNPFVFLPEPVLESIFEQSGKRKGQIPVKGTVNGLPYRQTLLRFAGEWRLYINTTMLKNSPKRIGEILEIGVEYDPEERAVQAPKAFLEALKDHPLAAQNFEKQSPSRQKEIMRYLANLKSEEALARNVKKVIGNLKGEGTYFGRKLAE